MLKQNLIFEPLGSELLIYDVDSAHAHSLSGDAARVALLVREGHSSLSAANKVGISADRCQELISEFKQLDLLQDDRGLSISASDATVGRRALMTGVVTAAAAGAIVSIKVPEAGAAGSCGQRLMDDCTSSTTGAKCCGDTKCCCQVPSGNTAVDKLCRWPADCAALVGTGGKIGICIGLTP